MSINCFVVDTLLYYSYECFTLWRIKKKTIPEFHQKLSLAGVPALHVNVLAEDFNQNVHMQIAFKQSIDLIQRILLWSLMCVNLHLC